MHMVTGQGASIIHSGTSGVYALLGSLIAGIFLIDLVTPNEVAVPVLYMVPLALTVWRLSRTAIIAIAGVCLGLTLLGYFLAVSLVSSWVPYNRAMSMIGLTACTGMALVNQRNHQKIMDAHDERCRREEEFKQLCTQFEERVAERTADLQTARRAALNILDDTESARQRAEQAEAEVRATHAELEQRVSERTTELAETNARLKQTIRERGAAEEQFRLVVEGAPIGMIMVNQVGRIMLVNAQIEKVFGYGRDELLGQSMELLVPERFKTVHPGHRDRFFAAPIQRAMGTGRELYGLRKDGSEFPLEIGLNPIEMADGVMVMASIIDITERKRAEESSVQQTAELARSNSELEQFAYVASHDLQEPLRMVSSYCGLLARRYKGKLDNDADDFIHFAVDGATRMRHLIDDLMLYSRVGRRERPFVPINSTESLRAAIANLEIAIGEAHAVISCDPLPTVFGDHGQLTQVFQNLIGNALKFRGNQDAKIHISARCVSGGHNTSEWMFSVQDNGIGFEQQFNERVFVIFQRLHTRDEYSGNGMGLAITKKIIERHGGRIWVESKPAAGSTFFFTLRGQPSEKRCIAA
jgi:PAS domain S-box-containing protein